MRVRVDLLPREDYRGELVVVVDVLRAGTVAPVLFDNGLDELAVTVSMREARRVAEDGSRLIGEREGLPPEGFNHAASPSLLQAIDFAGAKAVLVSENAPRALDCLVDGAEGVLLASLYNASAVAAEVASRGASRVAIVCSAFRGQEDLDDTLAAGFLAGAIASAVDGVELAGAARLAVTLVRAFPEPLEALWQSSAGRELRRLQAAQDLAIASLISQSSVVPELMAVEAGRHARVHRLRPAAGA